jgi:hypothetical protein
MNSLRPLLAATFLLGASGLIGTARADIFTVQGSTSGTFYDSHGHSQGSSIGNLSYTSTSFGPTTGDSLSLGSLNLGGSYYYDYTGDTFDLTLNFSNPANVSGSPLVADLSGFVFFYNGSVSVSFTGPVHFTFPGGSFDVTASNLDLSVGDPTVHGTISNETASLSGAPEPFSVLLLGSCLGIVALTRRKVLSEQNG